MFVPRYRLLLPIRRHATSIRASWVSSSMPTRVPMRMVTYRHLNSLNTVGYKELFAHFDGTCTLEFAIEKIKQNSRIYSRKQMTWFRRDEDIHWFHPDETEAIMNFVSSALCDKHE